MLTFNIMDSLGDLEDLSGRLADDQDYLYELLSEFIYDVQIKLDQLGILLRQENLEDIRTIVHSFKGSALYLNMHFIWQTACMLENAADRKDLKMVDIYHEVLRKEHNNLQHYLVELNG